MAIPEGHKTHIEKKIHIFAFSLALIDAANAVARDAEIARQMDVGQYTLTRYRQKYSRELRKKYWEIKPAVRKIWESFLIWKRNPRADGANLIRRIRRESGWWYIYDQLTWVHSLEKNRGGKRDRTIHR